MEDYMQIIFLLALIKFSLKAALTGRIRIVMVYAAGAALAAFALYPWIITQPAGILTHLSGDRAIVADGAVLITIESVAGIFASIYLIDRYSAQIPPSSEKMRGTGGRGLFRPMRPRLQSLLRSCPGLLAFAGIGYFELLFFRNRSGADFTATALLFAGGLALCILAAAWTLHRCLKQDSLKLEIKILLNIAILILGLLVNASVADYNVSHAADYTEWEPLCAVLLLFAAGGLSGWFLYRYDLPARLLRRAKTINKT